VTVGDDAYTVEEEQTQQYDPSHGEHVSDLATMNNLAEGPLLDVLRRRYYNDLIYTFVGDILVSFNPYVVIPGIYDIPTIAPAVTSGTSRAIRDDPHVFTVAERTYCDMMLNKCDQSLIVSGDSGAGKTEACYSLAELYRYGVSSAAISSTADDSTDVKTIAVDDKKAAQWLRMSAKMGDANGLFGLGLAFCEGRGVTQSWEEGLKHTVAAAERGLPHAIFNVGNHYYLGQGVKQDYARGVKEYKRAAEMGFVFAQTNLAIALIKGTGVQIGRAHV
jgi:hypothetical protein